MRYDESNLMELHCLETDKGEVDETGMVASVHWISHLSGSKQNSSMELDLF
jgi:hypothetical protein